MFALRSDQPGMSTHSGAGRKGAEVGEVLPVALGVVLGLGLSRLTARWRAVLLPPGSVVVGAAASAMNGELGGSTWALFVSFDALMVWFGSALSLAASWTVHRLRTAG